MTRDEAIKYLIKPVSTSTVPSKEIEKQFEAYEMAIEALRQESIVHAHWIHDFIDADWNCGVEIHCGWVCSNCNWYAEMESKTKYCPHCGAIMDEEEGGDK